MKMFKNIIAVLMIFVFLFGFSSINATASDNTITVKMINYNVAGMPRFDGKGTSNHKLIAEYIIENDYDIVAVQEDFLYNKSLVKNLDGFDYFTNHAGSIPGGDGLNVFTNDMPIYNEKRVQWDMSYGDISEGDLLTPKGLLYSVIEIADGVYIDFYNIHADAFESVGSREARDSNYDQILTMIEENYDKNNRPVIITGDFNHHFHSRPDYPSKMYDFFCVRGGMKEAWIELCNDGNYFDFAKYQESDLEFWGNWDSVEKFMYKDGGGVRVTPKEFNYTWILDENGESLSDHAAAECVFEFTITDDFAENTQTLEVIEQSPLRNFFNTIKWIFKDLIHVVTHLGEFVDMIA